MRTVGSILLALLCLPPGTNVVMAQGAQDSQATAASQMPGCGAEHLDPFRFWVGAWDAFDTEGQLIGRDSIAVVLGGCALHETWQGGGGHAGNSYTSYRPSSGTWYQMWVDNGGTVLPLRGGPTAGGELVLEGTITGRDGQPLKSRITWTPCTPECGYRQHWEISRDDGATWQTFSDLRFGPRAPSTARPAAGDEELP